MGLCINCKYHRQVMFDYTRIDICDHPNYIRYNGVDGTRMSMKWCQDLNSNNECLLFIQLKPEKFNFRWIKDKIFGKRGIE